MTACDECLAASLLRNEAAGVTARRILPTTEARRLLAASPDELRLRLRRLVPDLDARLAEVAAPGSDVWTICAHCKGYPGRLSNLQQPPDVLYGRGEQAIVSQLGAHPGVALVGARRASSYGREVAYGLGRDLAAAGMTIVSGMALGIDGAAHRGALAVGGRTIAVLAAGPEQAYPSSHARLYDQIVDAGAVVSERPPGARAFRWGFPARNRLIAGLSVKTVVVEGTESSGAMHTVSFAEELGQTVAAVPGPVTSPLSSGPNKLIAEQGGGLVRDAQDVLDEIFLLESGRSCSDRKGVKASVPGVSVVPGDDSEAEAPKRPSALVETLDPRLLRVYEAVASGDATAQAVAAGDPDASAREIAIVLGQLELLGHIERNERGGYRAVSTVRPRAEQTTR